jgi:hypothetical protein
MAKGNPINAIAEVKVKLHTDQVQKQPLKRQHEFHHRKQPDKHE